MHFIGEYLSDLEGLHYSHYTNRDQPYMVVSSSDTKKPDVLLSGHIDVVPGSDEQFKPQLRGGRLYGRGSLDMKGGVATIVKLFHDLLAGDRSGLPSLALMLTSDEEKGSVGAKWLVRQQGWRAKFILIPEGEEKWRFVAREKGVCWIRMKVAGKAAHAAYPWRADNPLMKLYGAYQKVNSLFDPPADKWQSTVSLTKIVTDKAARNQVPAYAEAILDVRYTEDLADSGREVIRKFKAVAPEVKFELIENGDRLSVADDDPYLQHLRAITSKQLGRKVTVDFNNGASDASGFASLKVPAMTSGITGANHHGDNEYVKVVSMVDYYGFAKKFIETFNEVKK